MKRGIRKIKLPFDPMFETVSDSQYWPIDYENNRGPSDQNDLRENKQSIEEDLGEPEPTAPADCVMTSGAVHNDDSSIAELFL